MGRKKSPYRRCRACNKATANESQICIKCMEKGITPPKDRKIYRKRHENGSYGMPNESKRKYQDKFINKVKWFFLIEKLLSQSHMTAFRRTLEKFGLVSEQLTYVLSIKHKQEDGSLR